MLTYALGPFVIMLICSMIIIYKLYSSKNENTKSMKSTKREKPPSRFDEDHINISRESSLRNELKTRKSTTQLNNSRRRPKSIRSKNSLSKQTQITSILLTTNFLFISLVSPLLVMNAFNMLQEDTLKTTLAYFLSYANHG